MRYLILPLDIRNSVETKTYNAAAAEIDYSKFVTTLFKDMDNLADCLMHAAVGCSTESGELLDAIKKHKIYGKPVNLENVLEELGDLRFYYQAMLEILNVTDEQVQAVNICKLMLRYPEGKYTDFHASARLDKE